MTKTYDRILKRVRDLLAQQDCELRSRQVDALAVAVAEELDSLERTLNARTEHLA